MAEFTTIRVRTEVRDQLSAAVKMLKENTPKGPIPTIAGLVARLAQAYENQLSSGALAGSEDWIVQGVPVVLNSDARKHFEELKQYEPVYYMDMVTNYIRSTAMELRFKQVRNGDE